MYSMQPATWASPWDHKEVDTMKCLSLSLFIQPLANKMPPGVKFKGTANKTHQDKCHKSQITVYSHPSCYRNNDDSWLFINKRYKNLEKKQSDAGAQEGVEQKREKRDRGQLRAPGHIVKASVVVQVRVGKEFPDVRQNESNIRVGDAVRTVVSSRENQC